MTADPNEWACDGVRRPSPLLVQKPVSALDMCVECKRFNPKDSGARIPQPHLVVSLGFVVLRCPDRLV